jgi:hypothetical protein
VRMRNWDCKDTGREERMGWFLFFFLLKGSLIFSLSRVVQ